MKKLLIISGIMVASALGAFAQGTVTFANNSTSRVIDESTGLGVATSPAGAFKVALYYAVDGVNDPNSFIQIGASANFTTPPGAGLFSAGTYTTPGTTAPGGFAHFQVRAWETVSGTYTTWESAQASGVAKFGSSNIVRVQTGNGSTIPTGSLTGSGLESFVIAVPEPSTYALGALAVGSLFFFRRRK